MYIGGTSEEFVNFFFYLPLPYKWIYCNYAEDNFYVLEAKSFFI